MTRRQAIFLVAAEEVAKARDFEYLVWANPKLPRSALRKARIATAAAEMRARRLLAPHSVLPAALEAAVTVKMNG